MVKHVVMFKLKEFSSPSEKILRMGAIKSALEDLPSIIGEVRSLRVDFNINPEEKWDLILTSEFDCLEDVMAYASHPAHVKVGKELIAPVRADRACVDFIE
jgi:hypothetical protein